jgi:protein gp37
VSTLSSIEWTDATWNPVRGCSKVSEGCRNCYAMKQAHRFSGAGKPYEGLTQLVVGKGPQWTGAVRTVPDILEDPLRWRAPRRVFVNSMSDLFHDSVATGFIDRVFAIMAMTPQHTYQVLTKRPGRMERYVQLHDRPLQGHPVQRCIDHFIDTSGIATREDAGLWSWPLPNVWLGTSVEHQAAADERIPHLLRTPAAVRFLSCEPLLGPVELRQSWRDYLEGWDTEPVHVCGGDEQRYHRQCPEPSQVQTERIDWVIAGGESGPGARPCNVEWVRSLVEQCRAAAVPVFVKQMGALPTTSYYDDAMREEYEAHGWEWPDPIDWDIDFDGQPSLDARVHVELRDRKGGDPSEWPEDIRVREFPGFARCISTEARL